MRSTVGLSEEKAELEAGVCLGNLQQSATADACGFGDFVTMKLVRTGHPVEGGVGNRRFDIFKEAGGPDRAVDRTFHKLHPNAPGKLVISWVPVDNHACVYAIEVIDEGRYRAPLRYY